MNFITVSQSLTVWTRLGGDFGSSKPVSIWSYPIQFVYFCTDHSHFFKSTTQTSVSHSPFALFWFPANSTGRKSSMFLEKKKCTDQFVGCCSLNSDPNPSQLPATPLKRKHVLTHFSKISGLFIGVLQRTGRLINSNFVSCSLICWEIFSLAFGSFFTLLHLATVLCSDNFETKLTKLSDFGPLTRCSVGILHTGWPGYLCNDPTTVLECFQVSSICRSHTAAYSMCMSSWNPGSALENKRLVSQGNPEFPSSPCTYMQI